MNFNLKKYSRYLPSKSFMIIAGVIATFLIILLLIFFIIPAGINFVTGNKKDSVALKIENPTVLDLIQKDSDGDGVPDWEEALWGTDPNKKMTFDNMPDATYIANKKKALKIESSVNEKNLTETDKFAREFFTSYSAMKSSGQVDKNSINNFSSTLGQKIVTPDLLDSYTEANVKIDTDNSANAQQQYYLNTKKLFKNYQSLGMGNELDIVSSGFASNPTNGTTTNNDQYNKLTTIANAYKDFAKKIMEMSVPPDLKDYHLQMANDSNNVGVSVLGMSKMASDPIVGLSGLSQYQKYSDDLIKTVTNLENFLTKQ